MPTNIYWVTWIAAVDGYNDTRNLLFSERFGMFWRSVKLSPGYAQQVVDKLLKDFAVGTLQRAPTQEIRGLQRGPFGYNEGPTSSCHTFLLEGASPFLDVPFFYVWPHPAGLHIASRFELSVRRLSR
ncbi:hypothetical protein AACH06_13420 [Ideonella sp. DXS29W]|uniref:Uncharacterized protein n=1 Tax=Ideonella lacteola TaxID=2984193 RepID=A0ABU9BPM5_9BURK